MQTHSKIQIRWGVVGASIALCMQRYITPVLALVILALPAHRAAAETELLMFESAGCSYCAQWHAEVGPEYPITPEGLAAPLRSMALSDARDGAYDLVSRPRFTPTFVLVQDGVEVGRIEGYPGEDFFWGLLGRLLEQATPES